MPDTPQQQGTDLLRRVMAAAAAEWNFQADMTDEQRAALDEKMGEAGAEAYLKQRLLCHLPNILQLAGFELREG